MSSTVAGSVVWTFEAEMVALEKALADARKKVKSASQGIQDDVDKQMKKLQESLGKASQSFNKAGDFFIKLGAPAVATLGLAAKAAIEYEDAFAGIRKTMDASESEFKALSDNIRQIAKVTPISTTELSRIGEIAGQLGIRGVDNVTKFTKTIADISATTDLTSDQAAIAFARIANVMQEPIENVDRLGAAIVDLGNNFAASEPEIAEFAQRIAGASKIAGLSTSDVFGIATAFSAVGVEAEAGGTAVQKVLIAMQKSVATGGADLNTFAKTAGMTSAEFKQAFEKDAAGAFASFVSGLGKEGDKAFTTLEELGLQDQRLIRSFLSVANAGDLLTDTIRTSGEAWEDNSALSEEARKRYETTASQMKIFKNNINDVGIVLGDVLLPKINDLIDRATPLIQRFADFAERNPGLITGFLGVGAAIGGLGVALKGVSIILSGFKVFFDFASFLQKTKWLEIGKNVGKMFGTMKAAASGLFTFLAANPVVLIIGAIVLAIAALALAWKNNWGDIQGKTTAVVDWIGQKFEDLKGWIDGVVTWFSELPEKIGNFLLELPEKIASALGHALGTFLNWAEDVWNFFTVEVPRWIVGVAKWLSELPGKIKEELRKAWESFKQWGIDTWNYLKEEVPKWITNIQKWIKELPGKIQQGLSDLGNTVRNSFSNAWNSIINEVSQWPGRILDWGRNIGRAFVDGVKSALSGLKDAFMRGFNDARGSIEGKSPPKEGPLKNIDRWGYNIGQAWVEGLQLALSDFGLSGPDVALANASSVGASTSGGAPVQNITITVDRISSRQDIDSLIRELGYRQTLE